MSIDNNQPGRPELYAINGDGQEDREGRLKRARAAVESALGLRHKAEEGPYGHLSPVPSPSPEPETPAATPETAQDGETPQAGNVTRISEAPSYRARQIDAPGLAEGSAALDGRPMPVSAEGEIDGRYHRVREARLEVDAARETMPGPDASRIEELFK
jgi:hypothetical protein